MSYPQNSHLEFMQFQALSLIWRCNIICRVLWALFYCQHPRNMFSSEALRLPAPNVLVSYCLQLCDCIKSRLFSPKQLGQTWELHRFGFSKHSSTITNITVPNMDFYPAYKQGRSFSSFLKNHQLPHGYPNTAWLQNACSSTWRAYQLFHSHWKLWSKCTNSWAVLVQIQQKREPAFWINFRPKVC